MMNTCDSKLKIMGTTKILSLLEDCIQSYFIKSEKYHPNLKKGVHIFSSSPYMIDHVGSMIPCLDQK